MSYNKKASLGRGLSALLGESLEHIVADAPSHVLQISIEKLKPGVYQPRSYFDDDKLSSLIESIREKGIIQPLVVRQLQNQEGFYEIVAGERRWRAAKTLNIQEVPVVIRECSDTEALELAIIENIQRDDLNPLEEAQAYQRLMTAFNYTQEEVAKRIGKSRSYVANMVRLNMLPANIKAMILEGKLSAGHARALLTANNSEELANEIVNNNLNVRDVEKRVKEDRSLENSEFSGKKRVPLEKSDDVLSLEKQLSEILGTDVFVNLKKDKGSIVINFNSLDSMDDIIQKIRYGDNGSAY